MKARLTAVVLLFTMFSVSAFAGSMKNISLSEPTKVGDTVLRPGEYVLRWEGNGPAVQVKFERAGKVVATASAQVQSQPTRYDGAINTRTAADNSKVLTTIDWKKMSLVFDQQGSGEAGASAK